MHIGIKFEIYPTKEQEKILFEYCRASHDMWNIVVAKDKGKETGWHFNDFGIKEYTPCQLLDDYGAHVPKRIALYVLKKYSQAKKMFFEKIRKHPKFHKFDPNKQSFCLVAMTHKINLKNKLVNMPRIGKGTVAKSQMISFKENIPWEYIVDPTYKYEHKRWWLCGSTKIPDVQKQEKEIIGLDWGMKNFMTSSKSEKINYPVSIRREYQRIRKLQSILDKKQRNSNNWNKLKNKLDKAYYRLRNLKKDFIEKNTTNLAREYSIAIEDLNMVKILEKMPSRRMRRIKMIQPYYNFVDKLQWKCEKFGSYFYKVDPKFTSMACSNCGNVKEHKIPLNVRVYHCEHCGFEIDRDINAARNIAALATCNS